MTVEVRLYTGAGCHLCDDARAVLERAREALGFQLVETPVDGDPELEAAYRDALPVVTVDGRRAFKYRVDARELARRVAAADVARAAAQPARAPESAH